MMTFKTGTLVKTTKKFDITDPQIAPVFIRNRRNTDDSVIDSPIYLKLNKLWLVKHSTSKLVRGISIGFYGVYHEDEIEITEPKVIENEDDE